MAYEDLMVTKIGYQQLDNTLACSKLQDSGESKSKNKREKPREDWEERVSRRFARLDIRELKQRRFWATHVNRKWAFFSFSMPWR